MSQFDHRIAARMEGIAPSTSWPSWRKRSKPLGTTSSLYTDCSRFTPHSQAVCNSMTEPNGNRCNPGTRFRFELLHTPHPLCLHTAPAPTYRGHLTTQPLSAGVKKPVLRPVFSSVTRNYWAAGAAGAAGAASIGAASIGAASIGAASIGAGASAAGASTGAAASSLLPQAVMETASRAARRIEYFI